MSKANRSKSALQTLARASGIPANEIASRALAQPVKFAHGEIYQVPAETKAGDIAERISAQLDHAHGILVAIHGGGIEQFHECSQEVQDEILSGLHNMVTEARELFGLFLERTTTMPGTRQCGEIRAGRREGSIPQPHPLGTTRSIASKAVGVSPRGGSHA